jgi:hypothetical protein
LKTPTRLLAPPLPVTWPIFNWPGTEDMLIRYL